MNRIYAWLFPLFKWGSIAALSLFFVQVLVHNYHYGYADNGDYARLSLSIVEKPVGFTTDYVDQREKPAEFKRRFCTYWLPRWETHSVRPTAYRGSSDLFIFAGKLISLPFNTKVFHLFFLGLLPNIAVFGLVIYSIVRASRVRSIAFYILCYLVFIANVYQLFASTFYSDFYVMAGFLGFVILFYNGKKLLALISALLSIAKTQMIFMPLSAWFVFRDKKKAALLLFPLLACVTVFCMGGEQMKLYTNVNDIHRIFCGALTVSARPAWHLEKMGLRGQMNRIEGTAFDSNADLVKKITLKDYLRIVRDEPLIPLRLLKKAGRYIGGELLVPYLGMTEEHGTPYRPPLSMELRDILLHGVLEGRSALLLLLLALALAVFNRYTGDIRIANLLMILVTSFVLSYGIAIAGEGFHEAQKHLVISNFIYDLLRVTTFLNMLVILFTIVKKERGSILERV